MVNSTSISKDAESYRRGVVFGLTMAEVLLLLIFCILLFLKIINDRLNDREKQVKELSNQNSELNEDLAALRSIIAVSPEISEGSEFLTEVVEAAALLEATQSEKASEMLQALQENPKLLQQIQLSTVDEWAELTAEAQYSVTESEHAVLSNLTEEQKQTFFSNAEIASNISPNDLQEILAAATKPQTRREPKNEGNNWPPIISLSEAKDYSFNVGSATLAPRFRDAITGSIADQILQILRDYDADVIEVIGHTDPQPMRDDRITNLDDNSVDFLNSNRDISLRAKDNAGLGYARALSVTKELMKVPSLREYTILPYSAAQMITPNEELQSGSSEFDGKQLRRIEIRVRRKQ